MNAERRAPEGNAASDAADGPASIVTLNRNSCIECAGRFGIPKPGRRMCPDCHRAYLAGLARRRAAELRTPPLADFGWWTA